MSLLYNPDSLDALVQAAVTPEPGAMPPSDVMERGSSSGSEGDGRVGLPPLCGFMSSVPRRRERDLFLPVAPSRAALRAAPVLSLACPSGDSVDAHSREYGAFSPRPMSPYGEESPRGVQLLSNAVLNNFLRSSGRNVV
jgi:hypothetical protein